jgi:hypothetical protein
VRVEGDFFLKLAKVRIIILSHRTSVQLRNQVIGIQRGFKYTEHRLFGRRYLGVSRTTMSSAVHTLTQVKARSLLGSRCVQLMLSYRFISYCTLAFRLCGE